MRPAIVRSLAGVISTATSTVPGSPFAGGAVSTGVRVTLETSPVARIARRKSSSRLRW